MTQTFTARRGKLRDLAEGLLSADSPDRRTRAIAALVVGVVYFLLTFAWLAPQQPTVGGSDFTYPWLAAKAMLHGLEPYAFVRASPTPWGYELFYPATVGVAAIPFVVLSPFPAACVFVGMSCAVLSYVIAARGMWRLLMFAAAPVYQLTQSCNWSALLTASALWTPMLGIVAVKPNLALPLIAYQRNVRALIYAGVGGLLLVVVSLALQPAWPTHWLQALARSPATVQYGIPILTPWGAFMALALLRWRRPEARMALALACVPQNFFFYDQLPLLLVPNTRRELLVSVVIADLAFVMSRARAEGAPNIGAYSNAFLPSVTLGVYLPALIMILRRPNASSDDA